MVDVWSLRDIKRVCSTPFVQGSKWLSHPLTPTKRVLITPKLRQTSDWRSVDEQSTEVGLAGFGVVDHGDDIGIKCAIGCMNGRRIAIEISKLRDERSTTQLVLFESSDFNDQALDAEPIPKLERVGARVEHLIGAYRSRLLFLDRDLWICSINLAKPIQPDSYSRHFFIPYDWHSGTGTLMVRVTPHGDIVFVRSDEIAIIKPGLEYEELFKMAPS